MYTLHMYISIYIGVGSSMRLCELVWVGYVIAVSCVCAYVCVRVFVKVFVSDCMSWQVQ